MPQTKAKWMCQQPLQVQRQMLRKTFKKSCHIPLIYLLIFLKHAYVGRSPDPLPGVADNEDGR